MALNPRLAVGSAFGPARGTEVTCTGSAATACPTLAFSVRWNGYRFETACLDGTNTQYTTRSGASGNFNALEYTWLITAAPDNSYLEKYDCDDYIGLMKNVSNAGACSAPTPTDAEWQPIKVVRNEYANRTIDSYMKRTTKRTCLCRTTKLLNHHYNKPLTCFRPDLAGKYSVRLTITDSCVTRAITADVTASCPSPPTAVVELSQSDKNAQAERLVLKGSEFHRITFDARKSAPVQLLTR